MVTDFDSFFEDNEDNDNFLSNDAKRNDEKTNEIYLSIFINLLN